MRRPDRPHVDGYEDEEDCVGYYDPDEAERRGCDKCKNFDHRVSETSPLTGRQCYEQWKTKEDTRLQAIEDAMTPDEKVKRAKFLKELRELY